MNSNHQQFKCLEDVLGASQTYMDQFNELDTKNQGYLDENESQLYFASINFAKEFEIIWNSIHDMKDGDRLIKKQFIIIMFLAQYRHEFISIDQDSIYRLTEFSQSLRHCEESLQEIEHYRFLSLVTLAELRTKFSQAFFKFEDILRQISQSDTQQNTSQVPAFNVVDSIASPAQEKIMPGSFQEENIVSKSVPKPNYTALPQNDPGFLGQSHKKASTLTLRSQPISLENSHESHSQDLSDSSYDHTENNVVQGGSQNSSIPDVISNITAGVTGIASLVGFSNSPKLETRGLDTAQETNQDIVKSPQTDITPSPIKPKEVDDCIAIDPPVDLNNSDTDKKFTDEELNRGADALKEIGQSIPVTDAHTESFELPSTYIANRLADALNESNTQSVNEKNIYSSDSNSIENSNANKAIAAEVDELKSAIDTNINDFTKHMDDTVNARPELTQNEDGSFGYATIIVPGKDISEDMQQGALHLRAAKVHTEPPNDINTSFHTPSNNQSESLVIDSSFEAGDRNSRVNPTDATQTDKDLSDYPAKRSTEIERLERDIEEQLDILSNSASSDSESSHHQSPSSDDTKPRMNPVQLQSPFFRDKSTAEAIESLTNSSDNKRVSMADGQDRVLYVRDGFENFVGFGLKCLSKDRPSSI